jgi:hypothetical protein
MIQALAQHTNNEHFDTPDYAVQPLIDLGIKKEIIIWEPTDTFGRSGITSAFRDNGYIVESTSFDFLNCKVEGEWDMIVTNPPYNKKDAFIAQCILYDKPFALLLPLTALEGIRRGVMWRSIQAEFGLLVLDRRVEFTGEGIWFNTSWFTYKLFTGVKFAQL